MEREGQWLDLRILATTDLHGQILPTDDLTGAIRPNGGLARLADEVRRARAETTHSLLFDNGDFLQGTALCELSALDAAYGQPMAQAMNALGYTAGTLGNHDFNYGLAHVVAASAALDHPIVVSNLHVHSGNLKTRPWLLLPIDASTPDGGVQRLTLGVIGLVPPEILHWDRVHLLGKVAVTDMVDCASALVPHLRGLGADLVLALAHTGIAHGHRSREYGSRLARVDGLDILILGHTHELWPRFADDTPCAQPDIGKPYVMPGAHGDALGQIDLRLQHQDGRWSISRAQVTNRPIRANGPGPGAADVAAAALIHAGRMTDHLDAVVGELRGPLRSTDIFHGDAPMARLRRAAKLWYGRGLDLGGLPVFAAGAPFRGNADFYIPEGPLTNRHIHAMCPFPNSLTVLRMTFAQLGDWIERAVSGFRTREDGVPDWDLSSPIYDFDLVSDLRLTLDLTQPPAFNTQGERLCENRRVALTLIDGQTPDPVAELALVTSSYRAGGGGNFPGVSQMSTLHQTGHTTAEVLRDFLVATRSYDPGQGPDFTWVAAKRE